MLGTVPGQIGLVQAGEILKLILGIGKTLVGRFLVYDFLQTDFRTFAVTKNPACPLCGENATIKDLSGSDTSEACSM